MDCSLVVSRATAVLFAGAPEPLASEHPAQYGVPPAVRSEGRPDGSRPQVVHFWAQVITTLTLWQ